jgi:ADP-ribosyl-[dinitrogen reductase] hydrolase
MVAIVSGLIHGLVRDVVLAPAWRPLQRVRDTETFHLAIEIVVTGRFRQLQPSAIQGSSYAVKSLQPVLWAFRDSVRFSDGVLQAVNPGEDARAT